MPGTGPHPYNVRSELQSVAQEVFPDGEHGSRDIVVLASNLQKPGRRLTRVADACANNDEVRIVTRTKRHAAAVAALLAEPILEPTDDGAVLYQTPHPRQLPNGGVLAYESDCTSPAVVATATNGVELRWTDTTLPVPLESSSEQGAYDLPEGVVVVDEHTAGTAGRHWTVERGDGTQVSSFDSLTQLRSAYHLVHDWFQPDRLTYHNDVRIHYYDGASTTLETYTEPRPGTDETGPSEARVRQFFKQFTISESDGGIPYAEFAARYHAWAAHPLEDRLNRSQFHYTCHELDDLTIEDAPTPAKPHGFERVVADRVWRYPPVFERTL